MNLEQYRSIMENLTNDTLKRWFDADAWSLFDAFYLLGSCAPNYMNVNNQFALPSMSSYQAEGRELAIRSIEVKTLKGTKFYFPDGTLDYLVKPSDFILWAQNKKFDVPEIFSTLAKQQRTKSENSRLLNEGQKCKERCRAVATLIWKSDPMITTNAMVKRQELQEMCAGEYYQENTIRKWISDLNPNPRIGRPKNTDTSSKS